MTLYHGSYLPIEKPDISFSREKTDFGKGFYVTPIKEQAVSWARRFADKNGAGVISAYAFLAGSEETLPEAVKVLEFEAYSLEWLNFIMDCRLGRFSGAPWDLVIGGVANDKVFDTLQLYFDSMITADIAVQRLRYSKPNLQYCFRSQRVLSRYLRFIASEVIK